MNLGDNYLRHVNTSKPQLVHTPSKQSVAASDDFYSFSSGSTGLGPDKSRYETPPLRLGPSRDALQSESTIPPLRPVKNTQRTDNNSVEKAKVAILSTSHKIQRKPVSSSTSSEDTTIRRPISAALSPPTPGVDDTPYIQFAIDQLTRDEEVSNAQRNGSEASYLVERVHTKQLPNYRLSGTPRASSDPEKGFTRSSCMDPRFFADAHR